ncbi:MAG: T9SS type A sorting domain-containing protein [Bacteroidales bacterium]|nr:T9SS type A sorting domain-containing protein [Bacteroidales bacterium]MBQ8761687.1 T9SS type A sorting domain-containing protein [Bacteroidales bacterium]
MAKRFFVILALALFIGTNAFSQEWENILEYNNDDFECFKFYESKELSDGNVGVSSEYYYRSGYGDFYSAHPSVAKFSPNGVELCRNIFYKEGYAATSRAPYLFENENNELFALTTFSPDHDYTYFNYFKNFDNPPTDAIVGLYKLDENLQVEYSYEHSYPIDTFEFRGDLFWENFPNEASGNIFIFSAFKEEGDIVGAYVKSVSSSPDNSRGNDSLFFFRMNFEGEFLQKKGYDVGNGGGTWQTIRRRHHLIRTENHYLLYDGINGESDGYYTQGVVRYYDLNFDYITMKFIDCKDCGGNIFEELSDITVKRSRHNTTYLVSSKRNDDISQDCRLYEIDDDINIASDYVTIKRYVDRGTSEWDYCPATCSVDIADDNSVYFACNLNRGWMWDRDSYVMIERFDVDLNSISVLFYDIAGGDGIATNVSNINLTKDQGIILCGNATDMHSDTEFKYITKFPASAFVNIEEAHSHGLKLAVAYPNPGGDVMNIRTGLRNATLQVYDMQGRKVHQQIITDEVTSIDASKWENGTYIWELRAGNGSGNGSENGNENGNENGILESGKWVK